MSTRIPRAPVALMGGVAASDPVDVTDDLTALDSEGFWVVVLPFDGPPTCVRFATVKPSMTRPRAAPWPGTGNAKWSTSLDQPEFEAAIEDIRNSISAGDVYQVNLTRILSAPLPPQADVVSLGTLLSTEHPAPFSAVVRLPDHGLQIVSASPERFLSRRGDRVWSSPIKGTASNRNLFTDKDRAENVMIVDLVRNDLGRVCTYGTVRVEELLAAEEHPGLVHLVSTISGDLRPGTGWAELIEATFPPGSVTGAPKIASLGVISKLEPVQRGPYCGAIGWVDADRAAGELGVAIRTFWLTDDRINFGTGGAITWDSTASGEWDETVLKARRLIGLTSGSPHTSGGMIRP